MSNEENDKSSSNNSNKNIIGGIILVTLGVIFLLSNYELIEKDLIGKLWPLFLIVPGILMLLGIDLGKRKK